MNLIINNKTYSISISLFWGSDSKDVEDKTLDEKNCTYLLESNIIQLDIISSLSVPFVYGSFVYLDSKDSSKLMNLVDMPLVHGIISFCEMEGTDIPGADSIQQPFGQEHFVESIFITGIESLDASHGDKVSFKFNFASEDILKFTANIENISTFDKLKSDQETDDVNTLIKNLFGAAKLGDSLDVKSFKVNDGCKIKYINSSNDNLITALEYIYRKTYDDNFKTTKNCSYVRMIYNHTTHKYQQWSYDNVGSTNIFAELSDLDEAKNRDVVVIQMGKKTDPGFGTGTFVFNNSGSDIDSLESFEKIRYIDYDYKTNKFSTSEYEKLDDVIVKNKDEFFSNYVTRASVINKNGDRFKDVDYMREFTSSNQNGSVYDIITDSIFNNNFYRVEANGSIGRKAGDAVFVQFDSNPMTPFELMDGDYLITAIDNRFEAFGVDGRPSFKSIMDLHKPYIAPDSHKRK